ncbi:MAG TPA: NUDIX hydrolase [Beijerinckiaceae bacterium]|jgi:nudix-type nucleoside diphosphatase (YffH/AdpP family)
MPHAILATETLHEGWGRLLRLTLSLPDGRTMTREVEDHGQAVAVLPYDPTRRVATLVRQFRAAPFREAGEDTILEAPAGLLDEDDPAAGTRREALEEVGLRLPRLEPLGAVWSMPGVSTERMHLYLAPYGEGDRAGEGGGLAAEHEEIEVVEMPLSDLARRADAGELTDMKTFALVQTLRLRRPELF